MKFGSLFSGIGGFDLGLERAGMECRWQVEINDFCRRVLERHWPRTPRYTDVTKFCRRICDCEPETDGVVICPRCGIDFGDCECIGTDELLDTCGPVDLVVGGDPCQENSNARRSAGTRCPSLGDEFIRILAQLRPTYVVRENPGTVRRDAPWPWWKFRRALEGLGYAVLPFRFRACCAGADFRRDRMFLLAELQGTERERLEGNVCPVLEGEVSWGQDANPPRPDRWSSAPRICGRTPRIPKRMDRLKSLGNCIVPAVAEQIGRWILESAN